MSGQTHENDPGFIVAWRSKRKFEAGKFSDQVMTWGEAHREAERLQEEHPENNYWAEHVPEDRGHH